MAQIINTNLMAINAQRNLSQSQRQMATSLERLSSGLRINRAQDDAAGLALAAKFETQVRQDSMKIRNAADAMSFAQAGEAMFAEVQNMAQRMIELYEQTGGIAGSTEIKLELAQLSAEMTAQLGQTFNGTALNGGSVSGGGVSVSSGTAVTAPGSTAGSSAVSTFLTSVTTARATLGAQVNRAESRIRFLETNVESFSAAKSRIMDADFAVETANLTRTQILQQAGTAMLAQANALPQNALALLR